MNHYDFSKVDFVLDKTVRVIGIPRYGSDGLESYIERRVSEAPVLSLDIQINDGRFELNGEDAEEFIEDYNDYLALKRKGLVK